MRWPAHRQVKEDNAGPIISPNMFSDTSDPELRPSGFLQGSGDVASRPWMDFEKGHCRCRISFIYFLFWKLSVTMVNALVPQLQILPRVWFERHWVCFFPAVSIEHLQTPLTQQNHHLLYHYKAWKRLGSQYLHQETRLKIRLMDCALVHQQQFNPVQSMLSLLLVKFHF